MAIQPFPPSPVHLRAAGIKVAHSRNVGRYVAQAWLKFRARDPAPYAFEECPEGLVCTRTGTPPLWLPLEIGDLVHNARAALDHAVWQLVRANDGLELNRRPEFPVFGSETRCREKWPGRAKGMSDAALQVLYELKPYRGGNGLLWALHQLDIIDKHRLLLTTAAGVFSDMPVITMGVIVPSEEGQPGAIGLSASTVHIEPVELAEGVVVAPPPDENPMAVTIRQLDVVPHIKENVLRGLDPNAFIVLHEMTVAAAEAINKLDTTVS